MAFNQNLNLKYIVTYKSVDKEKSKIIMIGAHAHTCM